MIEPDLTIVSHLYAPCHLHGGLKGHTEPEGLSRKMPELSMDQMQTEYGWCQLTPNLTEELMSWTIDALLLAAI